MTRFMKNSEVEALSSWALDEALRRGAWGADVLYAEGAGFGLSLNDGEVEECVSGKTSGIGIRTMLSDGRQGIAYGNRLDMDSVKELVSWSMSNCLNSQPDEGISLYSGKLVSDPAIMLEDERIAEITPKERMSLCMEMTDIAKSADKRIISVRSAAWHDGWGASFYCTTTGLAGWEHGSSASCGVTVLAQDDESTEMGGYGIESRLFSELNVSETASEASRRTTLSLGASLMKTGVYTVVIEPETASSLVDIIGDLFCAPEIHKGRSLMKGRLGTAVASSCITLTDDALIPWKAGTSCWDSEGVPTGRTVIIERGEASSYLYNLQYAFKDGVKSTGNACRGMSSLPDVGTSNLILEPGRETPEALISNVKSGLYVTEFMGLHTVDPVSGDFSIGAKGLMIENGILTHAISGVTIASNLMDFIKSITAVGSDLKFFGSVAAPTMVVENVVIAGE